LAGGLSYLAYRKFTATEPDLKSTEPEVKSNGTELKTSFNKSSQKPQKPQKPKPHKKPCADVVGDIDCTDNHTCTATDREAGWYWCNKCQLLYKAASGGHCAAGNDHDNYGSGQYEADYSSVMICDQQNSWYRCSVCHAIFWSSSSNNKCAGTSNPVSAHTADTNRQFYMCTAAVHCQEFWKWCNKCGCMVYSASGASAGACAGGGNHAVNTSGAYQIGYL